MQGHSLNAINVFLIEEKSVPDPVIFLTRSPGRSTVKGGLAIRGLPESTIRWCLLTAACPLVFGGISKLTSDATSQFGRPPTNTIIWEGRKLGNTFAPSIGNDAG